MNKLLTDDQIQLNKTRAGMATFTKHGVEHYRRMGRLSAEKRRAASHWLPFTGDYDKVYYDVKLPSGEIVPHCWPNAGMIYTVPHDRHWLPGEVMVRKTRNQQWFWDELDTMRKEAHE